MRSKTLNELRNQLIYDMYTELWKSGLREEVIWTQIKEKFHLEESSIYRIVLAYIKKSNSYKPQIKVRDL